MINEELKKILEEVGFTDGESKVYLSLISLGESKVGPIIKKSNISRSKVYDILERLINKGIVSKLEKNKVFYYQSLPPQKILNLIKEKEKKLRNEEEILKNLIPELNKISQEQKVNILVYEGYDGFKTMIDQTIEELEKNDTYEAMGISETTEAMRHCAKNIYKAQKSKNFKARSIFDIKGAYKIAERKNPWHKMRILPNNWTTPALFTMYKDKVGIHLGKEDSIISIVIKNEDIAKSFKVAFEAMWKLSKEA